MIKDKGRVFLTCIEYFDNLKGKKVAVVGVGVSNTPLIKLLAKYKAKVTACDKKESLGEELENELKRLGKDTGIASDVREYYEDEKKLKKSQLLSKYSKYLK